MLARLGAGIKVISGGHLTSSDLAAMMGRSLTDPNRLLGPLLTESAYASWDAVTGNCKGAGFTENWRVERFLPMLQGIADQPTRALQRWKLQNILLTEEERLTTATKVLNLPSEEAEAYLIDYPNRANARNSFAWKRDFLGLEAGFNLLNICALLDLGQKGFGIDADDSRLWAELYCKAFEPVLRLHIDLRTLHVKDPHRFSLDTSQAAEIACEPIFKEMKLILSDIREDICNGRADAERFQERYDRLVSIPHREQT